MSLEAVALKNIEITSHRKLYRRKSDLLKALMPHISEYELEEIEDFYKTNRVIPDSWTFTLPKSENDRLQITAIEVEDTNKLTKLKLDRYVMLWFYLDCILINLNLETYDRYGIDCKKIPLVNFYISSLTESSNEDQYETHA